MHLDALEISLSLPESFYFILTKWNPLREIKQKKSLFCYSNLQLGPLPLKRVHFSVNNLRILEFTQSRKSGVFSMWCQRCDAHCRCPLVSPVRGALLFPAPAATQVQPPGPPLPLALRLNLRSPQLHQQRSGRNQGMVLETDLPPFCLTVPTTQETPLPLGLGGSPSPRSLPSGRP